MEGTQPQAKERLGPQKLEEARKDAPRSLQTVSFLWTRAVLSFDRLQEGMWNRPLADLPATVRFHCLPTQPPVAGLLLAKLGQDPRGSEGPEGSRAACAAGTRLTTDTLTGNPRAPSDPQQPRLSGAWWPCLHPRLSVAWRWAAPGKTGSRFCEAGERCPGGECRRRAVSCSRKMTEGFSSLGGSHRGQGDHCAWCPGLEPGFPPEGSHGSERPCLPALRASAG